MQGVLFIVSMSIYKQKSMLKDFTIRFGLEYSLSVVSGIALTMLSVFPTKIARTVKLNSLEGGINHG